MKLKELESELQPLKGFEAPIRELEQYVTSPHLAARMIYTAETSFEDIDEKDILDLGCGCAILSIACVMMGAKSVLSVDLDPSALRIAKSNIESVEMEDMITFFHAEISPDSKNSTSPKYANGEVPVFTPERLRDWPVEEGGEKGKGKSIDTVVMNPPFGSWRKGIDMTFLEVACSIANHSIYSLHKSSTRDFIQKKVKGWGFEGEVLAEMRYDLPKTMKFHKKDSVDIQVDFWRFERVREKEALS